MIARGPGIAAAALLAVVAVVGAVAPSGAALVWDVSLGGGVVHDDNLHFDPETPVEEGRRQPVSETIFTVSPGASLAWAAERDWLRLTYAGEHQQFSGDEDLDQLWVHDLAADLGWRRWAPFFVEASERRERVPRSRERETQAVVDQIDRNRASARAGFGWELGARGVAELAYRGELENYPGVDDADRVARQHGEGLWRYRWTPLVESEVRAAYGWVERDLATDFSDARASVAISQRLSERLLLRYGVEWVREEDDEPGEGEAAPDAWEAEVRTTLLKTVELGGTLERGGGWRVGYRDGLEGLPEGDTLESQRVSADVTLKARLGSSLRLEGWREARDYRDAGSEETAWGPVATARWLVAPWLACDAAASWTRTTLREPALPEVEDDTLRLAVGVVAVLYDRVSLEAGYARRENESTDPLRSYGDNLVYALLTIFYRPVPAGAVPASYASRLVTSPQDEPGQIGLTGGTVGGTVGGAAR